MKTSISKTSSQNVLSEKTILAFWNQLPTSLAPVFQKQLPIFHSFIHLTNIWGPTTARCMGHSDKIDKVPVLTEVGTADNKQENKKLSEIEMIYHSNMQQIGRASCRERVCLYV